MMVLVFPGLFEHNIEDKHQAREWRARERKRSFTCAGVSMCVRDPVRSREIQANMDSDALPKCLRLAIG